MKRVITCIVCPNGCEIEVELEGGKPVSLEGNLCPRGEAYAVSEITAPKRTISSSVLVENGDLPLVSVRLDTPVPKEKIFDVMKEIGKVRLSAPVHIGDIVIGNVLGLGSNVIATKNVKARA